MALDVKAQLSGDGLILVVEAARLMGCTPEYLLSESADQRPVPRVFTHLFQMPCWRVTALDLLEAEHDSQGNFQSFLSASVEEHGERVSYTGQARCFDSLDALLQLAATGVARVGAFSLKDGGGVILEDWHEVPLSACSVPKASLSSLLSLLRESEPQNVLKEIGLSTHLVAVPDEDRSEGLGSGSTHARKSILFSELLEAMRLKHKNLAEDTHRRRETEGSYFIELMGDVYLDDITDELIEQYAVELSKVPEAIGLARRRAEQGKPGYKASLQELAIAVREHREPPKTAEGVKRLIGNLSEILNFAVRSGRMKLNPAFDYRIAREDMKTVRAQDARSKFEPADLEQIFSPTWFMEGWGSKKTWRPVFYWLPLIGLFTGLRVNEAAQLYLTDVVPANNERSVGYFDINRDKGDKKLKNPNAVRQIPMHPHLLKLGLPAYVLALKEAGHERLFPELGYDPDKGYGKAASAWFNERFLGEQLGFERDGRKTFHSFRHSFATELDRLGYAEVRAGRQLMGHERGKSQTELRYAKDREAEDLYPIIEQLTFEGLPNIHPFNVVAGVAVIKRVEAARKRRAVNARKAQAPPAAQVKTTKKVWAA